MVYQDFETQSLTSFALTFDDFIPLAVDILESNSHAHQRWCGDLQFIIVDEYQDVNYGQQRLNEI